MGRFDAIYDAETVLTDALAAANVAYTTHSAETGSVYVFVGSRYRDSALCVVRIADHDECYPPADGEVRIDLRVDGSDRDASVAASVAAKAVKVVADYLAAEEAECEAMEAAEAMAEFIVAASK